MTSYVYALHDFVPEHDDEIPFKVGERIEIIERDDQYGDGWWQGRNLAGKVGLFPQSYTSAFAPILEIIPPMPSNILQPLQEERPEDLNTSVSPSPQPVPAVTDTVMAATLTDVQKAIEQLAVRRDTDTDAGRSFSFASTQGGETEDEGGDDNEGGGWTKDARKALAERAEQENARREREEAEANALYDSYPRKSSQPPPPIEVELSDESDDEQEQPVRATTPEVHPHHHKYSSSTSTMVAEPSVTLSTPSLATRHSQMSLPTSTSPSPLRDITTIDSPSVAAPRPQTPTTAGSKSFPNSLPSHLAQMVTPLPSPSTSSAATTTGDASRESSVGVSATPVRNSLNAPANSSLSISPTPNQTVSHVEPSVTPPSAQPVQPPAHLTSVPAQLPTAISTPLRVPTPPIVASSPVATKQPTSLTVPQPHAQIQMQSPVSTVPDMTPLSDRFNDLKRVHPSEWTVEQVVEWLKSKNVDDATCAKFIEHEITGDVLLELDVTILKEELNITAFGKRMRIANAIVELRRPASFSSEPHASFNSTGSTSIGGLAALSNNLNGGFVIGNGNSGDTVSNNGMSPVTDGPAPYANGNVNGSQRLDGMSVTSGENERLKVPKSRPAQLALSSPSDGALNATAVGEPSGLLVLEEGGAVEDRGVQSENEAPFTASSSGAFARSRRFLGLSTESGSSHSRKSADGGSIPNSPGIRSDKSQSISIEDAGISSLRHARAKKSLDGSASKGSDRLSFFGATLGGKSRKAPPRYSVFETDPPAQEQRPVRGISRLYHSGSKKSGRPTTAPGGSVIPFGGKKERDESQLDSTTNKDSAVLRKRQISTIGRSSNDPIRSSAYVGNGSVGGEDSATPPLDKKIELQPGKSVLDQIGEPDYAGWLKKKGEKYNSWKLRYLVLKGQYLYYLRGNSRTETKAKGYLNLHGYKIIADENTNPGKYGFRIIHDTEPSHYFSYEEQLPVREWMKALMKATIDRDYSKPVMSSCNIPTIPLTVAQAMNPAPRPPSPSQRDATQKALRRDNPNQLSSRDARILMGLPSAENGVTQPQANSNNGVGGDRVPLESFFELEVEKREERSEPTPVQVRQPPSSPPARPSRDARGNAQRGDVERTDSASEAELVGWANSLLPEQYQIHDLATDLNSGLVLLRLAEAIRGRPCDPPISDLTFKGENNLEGMFKLFDFLLDNDIKMGTVSINDVKQGRRDKTIQLLKALRAWGEKRKAMMRSIGKGMVAATQAGPWMPTETGTIHW